MKRSLLAIAAICSWTTVVAQKPVVIRGGEFCEGHLLKKVATEKAEGSRTVLRAFNVNAKTPPDLKKWLGTKDEENLVAVELKYKEKKALIFGSFNLGGTGIASNFQNWHVRFDERSAEFLSLSQDPKLIFWDRRGMLNYYVVSYGNEFLKDRDWNNLTLDLLRYRIGHDGKARLITEERDVRCK
jgi:hypothetical protein